MSEPYLLILAAAAGIALGFLFFGGLWWTVREGLTARKPALLFFGSFLLRTGVSVAGFYVVSHGRWERLLACLLGFVAARLVIMRLVRAGGNPGDPERKDDHAH